ncbi:MAG: hypothetical protein IID41_06860 [Planctomycetes bacterium]|nr:hypothetical protein [Planctomycetota bacterium]
MTQNSEKTASRRRGAGRPFRKGETGNPGGRPSLPAAFKAKGPDALKKLAAFMKDKDPRIALKATELVLARIYGNTTQPLEHDAGGDMLDAVAERIAQRMNGHS